MPSAYKASIHQGSSTAAFVQYVFAMGGLFFNSSYLMYNVWDNPAYIQWLTVDNLTYTDSVEVDQSWQPLILPFSARGFQIIDKTAPLHARFQVIALG